MGQVVAKLHTVTIGVPTDPSQHTFGSIQEAIDNVEAGSTIVLSAGDHTGANSGPIRMRSSLRFIGLQGARIVSPIIGDVTDVIYDNIIFRNVDNESIEFTDGKGYLFRNCEFHINIRGSTVRRNDSDIRFGFHLVGGSALLQNPIFCVDVEDLDVFIVIGADGGATYLSLQSPIIRVQYRNICKLETYFFRGAKNSLAIPYFESFSTSAHYRTDAARDRCYDGHCCVREKDRRRCGKRHCDRCRSDSDRRCKQSHSCCDKKCNRNKVEPATVRLFRGLDCVNASLMSNKVYLIEGKGSFNIAAGDAPIYVNGLTISATVGNDWEIGDFRNILLTSFMSNLKCACEIKECHCIEDCPKDNCDDNQDDCSEECDEPCQKHRCQKQFQPLCPQPYPCPFPPQPFPFPSQPCPPPPCPPPSCIPQPCIPQPCTPQPCIPQPCIPPPCPPPPCPPPPCPPPPCPPQPCPPPPCPPQPCPPQPCPPQPCPPPPCPSQPCPPQPCPPQPCPPQPCPPQPFQPQPCPPQPCQEILPIPTPYGANPCPPCPQPQLPSNCPPRWIKCKEECDRKKPKNKYESCEDSARYY